MRRYIALLRGININGKNKIAMTELKKGFAAIGFTEVVTYLNSGNVIFSSNKDEKESLLSQIEEMIKERFSLTIPTLIMPQEELGERLKNAPDWWGDENKEIYDNMIFMMPPLSYEKFCDEIGPLKEEYEKACHEKDVIFWSFSRKDYQKTNWWSKTASASVSDKLTIRTANTVRKIVSM